MKILAIETSCDETAIAIVEADGTQGSARFEVLGNALLSQIELHAQYGGVFPMMAKREHAKNLVPILEAALEEAEFLREDTQAIPDDKRNTIAKLLEREGELSEQFFAFVSECEAPAIDAIAVTAGPGLEPALWVGINFAKALSILWDKPLVAVNHMEGHIMAALAEKNEEILTIENIAMPTLALLISGGHTELVLMEEWLSYTLLGQTRDDAVGEAFDKVARMLGLPYPGGPEISKLAEREREHGPDRSRVGTGSERGEEQGRAPFVLPRPMINDANCDFSFAGLKTAVLYLIKDKVISDRERQQLAREFEDAVGDVLWKKTARALEQSAAGTLVIGGGVSANTHIRRVFKEKIASDFPHVSLRIPTASLTTDNAIMIALAGYYRAARGDYADSDSLVASGNLSLA